MCAVLLPVYIAGCCLVSVVGKRIGLDYTSIANFPIMTNLEATSSPDIDLDFDILDLEVDFTRIWSLEQ